MITSSSNGQIKYLVQVQKKRSARKQDRVFVVEGIKMFLEIPISDIKKAYVSESFWHRLEQGELPAVKKQLGTVPFEVVKEYVFTACSDTQTPQGIMALASQCAYDLPALHREAQKAEKKPLYVMLDGLQDPGNLGTIMRTAEAAGVTAVVMSADTVDIYNPKTVRSTMGAIFRVPFVYTEDLCRDIAWLRKEGTTVHVTALEDSVAYTTCDYTGATAFVIGNEANGVKSETICAAGGTTIHIPMEGCGESLNAAIAAAIVMFEAKRQRISE